MPFKSEKQRRYLWANEPEIARDWTDTYGSRIHKNEGGIMHQFENYAHDDGDNVSVPRSFQARSHSTPVHLAYITDDEAGILQALKPGTPHEGPMGLPNYNDFDAQGNYRSGAAMSAAESRGPQNERMRADLRAAGISPQEAADIRSGAAQAATMGQPRNLGINFSQPKNLGINFSVPGQNFMRNINPLQWAGNLIDNPFVSGAWSFLTSPFRSNLRQGMTQQEWEDARNERIRNKRIETILGRKAPITDMTLKNLEKLGYTGEMPAVGSSPKMMNMNNLGLYTDRVNQPIGPGKRIGQDQGYYDKTGIKSVKGIPFEHDLEASVPTRGTVYPARSSEEIQKFAELNNMGYDEVINLMFNRDQIKPVSSTGQRNDLVKQAGLLDYDWSSKDNPELQQKMNDAVDKAVNDYLGKIKSGEISFPDNLQWEIDKIGNKTRHDMIQSQSDQPEIFSETLQEGLDKSNIQQKQKQNRAQELLKEIGI